MSQCSSNIALKILILIILFSQFFVTDAFLANQFYYYGIDIFNYYRFHDKIVKLALFDIQSDLILNWKVASRGSGHEQHLQSHV